MTWMQGKALVNNGSQDLFCEFQGDPNLIERRFGGNLPHSHEKATENDSDDTTQAGQQKPEVDDNRVGRDVVARGDTYVPNPGNNLKHSDINEGPARNTRSRAGSSLRGRRSNRTLRDTGKSVAGCSSRRISNEKSAGGEANKNARAEDTEQLEHITAGIVAFSVYSNRQTEPREGEAAHFGPSTTGVDAGQWAHPVAPSAKVGGWLEKKAQACSQVHVDLPPSQAPSSAGIAL